MSPSKSKQIDASPLPDNVALACSLAPEDVKPGDMIAVLLRWVELPSFFWDADPTSLPPDQLVRLTASPERAGVPLRVQAVCLPFVLVKPPQGDVYALDLRGCRIARLDARYARAAWKAFKKTRV